VGDEDVTAEFNASAEVESGAPSAGLAFYRAVVRLAYVTSVPGRQLHGKRLVCTASATGFDDVNATSLLLVHCTSLESTITTRPPFCGYAIGAIKGLVALNPYSVGLKTTQ